MAGIVVGTRAPAANILPTQFVTTHNTDGLPGYGALDWFRKAGTIVGSPVSGKVERWSGRGGTSGSVFGYSMYIRSDSGQRLFLTHFGDRFVRPGQHVSYGQPLGRVSAWTGGATHIHIGTQGAKDVGGHVNLGRPIGLDPATRVPPSGQRGGASTVVGAVRGATGATSGAVSGAASGVGDAFGAGWSKGLLDLVGVSDASVLDFVTLGASGWFAKNWDRVLEVVGGFVITVAGLYLLARQLGAPKPPMPFGADEGLDRMAGTEQRSYESTLARASGRERAQTELGNRPPPSKPRARAAAGDFGKVPF